MIRALRAAVDAVAAVLERRAAEVRFGTDLMQAVHADNVLSQLRAATGSDEVSVAMAGMALDLTKNGARPDEVEELIRGMHFARQAAEFGVTMGDIAIAAQERRRREREAGHGSG